MDVLLSRFGDTLTNDMIAASTYSKEEINERAGDINFLIELKDEHI